MAAATGVAESSVELVEMAVGIGVLLSVPGFLLILSGMKLGGSGGRSPQTSGMPGPHEHPDMFRVSVGLALALVLLPAVLCPFTLWSDLSILQFVIIEALILTQAVPYALVLRGLNNTARKFEMPKAGFRRGRRVLDSAGPVWSILRNHRGQHSVIPPPSDVNLG